MTNNLTAAARSHPIAPIIFCDFDGTITESDVTDRILTEFAAPAWRTVEREWQSGAIGSRECLERQMALVETSARELHLLIDSIPVDSGFSSFYRFVRKHRVPFSVLSDGFDYVIRRVLKRAGTNGEIRNGVNLFASALRIDGRRLATSFPHADPPCEHGCATCKVRIIRRLAGEHRPVIFIGDGLSDRFGVKEADLVFARPPLAALCRQERIPCRAFETFLDVESALGRLLEGTAPGRRRQVAEMAF
jgi:2-hydroxy-3-keto-5-methylthiopentenyl-1-phosphate phosphatase